MLRRLSMLALGLVGLESVTSDPSLEWDSGGGVRGRGGEGGGTFTHTYLPSLELLRLDNSGVSSFRPVTPSSPPPLDGSPAVDGAF